MAPKFVCSSIEDVDLNTGHLSFTPVGEPRKLMKVAAKRAFFDLANTQVRAIGKFRKVPGFDRPTRLYTSVKLLVAFELDLEPNSDQLMQILAQRLEHQNEVDCSGLLENDDCLEFLEKDDKKEAS